MVYATLDTQAKITATADRNQTEVFHFNDTIAAGRIICNPHQPAITTLNIVESDILLRPTAGLSGASVSEHPLEPLVMFYEFHFSVFPI